MAAFAFLSNSAIPINVLRPRESTTWLSCQPLLSRFPPVNLSSLTSQSTSQWYMIWFLRFYLIYLMHTLWLQVPCQVSDQDMVRQSTPVLDPWEGGAHSSFYAAQIFSLPGATLGSQINKPLVWAHLLASRRASLAISASLFT